MLLLGLADFASHIEILPRAGELEPGRMRSTAFPLSIGVYPTGSCFASTVGSLIRIDAITLSRLLSMGDTVEFPNLTKPEPKGLGVLYKYSYARDWSKVEL